MPGYVTFNIYFSPISQMCTQNTTTLKIFPVSRKIYIVCQFGPLENEFGVILSFPLAMWESIENLSPIPQICTLNATVLAERIFGKFAFSELEKIFPYDFALFP